ncbi:uncharacterized protein LOC114541027 [Dendronephthya gigantea]|uniref:uncharacterized protein LOC114541027 n=1 Tax=Dendronephthya gigantea TaxID=151771 RepID=UPI00106C2A83|nr:uncharacterized protein LOC114541027 [Dendronephthya gigantea]
MVVSHTHLYKKLEEYGHDYNKSVLDVKKDECDWLNSQQSTPNVSHEKDAESEESTSSDDSSAESESNESDGLKATASNKPGESDDMLNYQRALMEYGMLVANLQDAICEGDGLRVADVSVAQKRPCVPEGNTPGKPAAKVRTRTESGAGRKRCLFGGSCRSRVSKHLAKHYATLTEAALGIDYVLDESIVKTSMMKLRDKLLGYFKELYSKKRIAATHLMIFMISDELRNTKPYAVPVRFMPYSSITDAKLRELELQIEDAMVTVNMVAVGFTTDGEFNSLRTNGKSRPVSVIEIIKNAKKKATSLSVGAITKFFTLDPNGNLIKQHPSVPVQDVNLLCELMSSGDKPMAFYAALLILRRTLFPFCHDPNPWVKGRQETIGEVLKSLMEIYLYRSSFQELKNNLDSPADFYNFMYQPEKDVRTNEYVHHREDHNHLLKRVISRVREGYIPNFDLRCLREALCDPSTGLTYEALTGKNKQSVPDCERMISQGVIQFLNTRGYSNEARVLEIFRHWHLAADGRGISEEVRFSYLKEMKDWILDDWMPWHNADNDYSFLDVNRPIKGICGLTRELIVGLTANLESRELRRIEYIKRGLRPEHPRASSSDDVEGFVALLHKVLGLAFDLKQFYSESTKILNEFKKRIDPKLAFYYWTGVKDRYRDFELPSFNQPTGPGIVERLDKQ